MSYFHIDSAAVFLRAAVFVKMPNIWKNMTEKHTKMQFMQCLSRSIDVYPCLAVARITCCIPLPLCFGVSCPELDRRENMWETGSCDALCSSQKSEKPRRIESKQRKMHVKNPSMMTLDVSGYQSLVHGHMALGQVN